VVIGVYNFIVVVVVVVVVDVVVIIIVTFYCSVSCISIISTNT